MFTFVDDVKSAEDFH